MPTVKDVSLASAFRAFRLERYVEGADMKSFADVQMNWMLTLLKKKRPEYRPVRARLNNDSELYTNNQQPSSPSKATAPARYAGNQNAEAICDDSTQFYRAQVCGAQWEELSRDSDYGRDGREEIGRVCCVCLKA